MKPFGAILEFTRQRNDELMRAYRTQLRLSPHISMARVSAAIVRMPAPRFWVSEERAASVVTLLLAGRDLPPNMRPTKVRMFSEIFRRYLALRDRHPDASLQDLVSQVVNSSAPEFYMLPRSAMDIIYKIKKGLYNEQYFQSLRRSR